MGKVGPTFFSECILISGMFLHSMLAEPNRESEVINSAWSELVHGMVLSWRAWHIVHSKSSSTEIGFSAAGQTGPPRLDL